MTEKCYLCGEEAVEEIKIPVCKSHGKEYWEKMLKDCLGIKWDSKKREWEGRE